MSLKVEYYVLGFDVTGNLANAIGVGAHSCSRYLLGCLIEGEGNIVDSVCCDINGGITFWVIIITIVLSPTVVSTDLIYLNSATL